MLSTVSRILVALLAITILAFTLPAPLLAQEPVNDPLFSAKRLSLSFGVEREVLQTYAESGEAWRAVLPLAYNILSPQPGASGIRFSLTARPSIAFTEGAKPELWVGGRVWIVRGAP